MKLKIHIKYVYHFITGVTSGGLRLIFCISKLTLQLAKFNALYAMFLSLFWKKNQMTVIYYISFKGDNSCESLVLMIKMLCEN